MISPSHPVMRLWMLVQDLINIYASFKYAYSIAMFKKLTPSEKLYFENINLALEAIFFFDLLINFFVAKKPAHKVTLEYDIRKLAILNLKGRFLLDLVTWFPFNRVSKLKEYRILYLIRVARIEKGMDMFKTKRFRKWIKGVHEMRLERLMKKTNKDQESTT